MYSAGIKLWPSVLSGSLRISFMRADLKDKIIEMHGLSGIVFKLFLN